MKLEIKQPEQPAEPVAKLWLEQTCHDALSLRCQVGDGCKFNVAFFDMTNKTFHVFEGDMKVLGYTLTSN